MLLQHSANSRPHDLLRIVNQRVRFFLARDNGTVLDSVLVERRAKLLHIGDWHCRGVQAIFALLVGMEQHYALAIAENASPSTKVLGSIRVDGLP